MLRRRPIITDIRHPLQANTVGHNSIKIGALMSEEVEIATKGVGWSQGQTRKDGNFADHRLRTIAIQSGQKVTAAMFHVEIMVRV